MADEECMEGGDGSSGWGLKEMLKCLVDALSAQGRGEATGAAGGGAVDASHDDKELESSDGHPSFLRGCRVRQGRQRTLKDLAYFVDSLSPAPEWEEEGRSGDTRHTHSPEMRVARWISRACVPLLRRMGLLLHLLGLSLPDLPQPPHPLATCNHNHEGMDLHATQWEHEYRILCARMRLPSLLPPSTDDPVALAEPYYAAAAAGSTSSRQTRGEQVGVLGVRDGALWMMMQSWAERLGMCLFRYIGMGKGSMRGWMWAWLIGVCMVGAAGAGCWHQASWC